LGPKGGYPKEETGSCRKKSSQQGAKLRPELREFGFPEQKKGLKKKWERKT